MSWLIVTLVTKPEDKETLRNFYRLVYPGGPGWKKVIAQAEKEGVTLVPVERQGWDVPAGILCMFLGSFAVITSLFATGYVLYGKYPRAGAFILVDLSVYLPSFEGLEKTEKNII